MQNPNRLQSRFMNQLCTTELSLVLDLGLRSPSIFTVHSEKSG